MLTTCIEACVLKREKSMFKTLFISNEKNLNWEDQTLIYIDAK
jgi:hypothetical protein